jgi:hypothetical protein
MCKKDGKILDRVSNTHVLEPDLHATVLSPPLTGMRSPRNASTRLQRRPSAWPDPEDPLTRAAALLNAAAFSIAGLYRSTQSVPLTLIGFAIAACLAAWYLWTQHDRSQ